MNKKELGEEVLAHWTRLSACKTRKEINKEGYGIDACAFCQEYYDEGRDTSGQGGCEGCPISMDTRRQHCENTPYGDFFGAMEYGEDSDPVPSEEIEAELGYLTDLMKRMEE
jgi:hypothetical protein